VLETKRSVALLLATALLAATGPSSADERPASLWEAIFGPDATPQISRVVVIRINPWISKALDPTPHSFELGQAGAADSTATMTDSAGITALESELRGAGIGSEGCYGTQYTAKYLPVSWAIFFYTDRYTDTSRIGGLYLTLDGLCVSTGTKLYNVDPQIISLYLKRNFSFMNF
jgi:hypothetical protein